jgi:hypothetical protein
MMSMTYCGPANFAREARGRTIPQLQVTDRQYRVVQVFDYHSLLEDSLVAATLSFCQLKIRPAKVSTVV